MADVKVIKVNGNVWNGGGRRKIESEISKWVTKGYTLSSQNGPDLAGNTTLTFIKH